MDCKAGPSSTFIHLVGALVLGAILVMGWVCASAAEPSALLMRLSQDVSPAELHPEATAFGGHHESMPLVALVRDGDFLAWAFVTSDFVSTIGYSGKPIHTMMAVDEDAVVTGVKLVEHSEPIVLIGIPDSEIQEATARYAGLDLKAEADAGGTAHDLDIIAGATVTIIVIDDAIVRAGLKVARALGLGGLAPPPEAATKSLKTEVIDTPDWQALKAEGAIGQLELDISQVNEAFAERGDPQAASRPERGEPGETFIDLNAALVSVPTIGRALMGKAEYDILARDLVPGQHAILVMGRGRYSFKGSGYVRGGLFDRIQLIQGDTGVRWSDKQHRRLGTLAAAGSPSFAELDIFTIPVDAGFDPAKPWRLQLLVQRSIGPIRKSFLTFDLAGQVPPRYFDVAPSEPRKPQSESVEEAAAKTALWQRIWRDRAYDIAGLVAMLGVLTGAFFFQIYFTRSERFVFWFRMGFLTLTLVFLGWYANAQLSVVNLMALAGSLVSGFTWEAFLLDPMVFILWFSVAAALIFWGRGAYCGWLCPFGALQELSNRIARWFRVPQWDVPWSLHERLWALKYLIFLGLFGVSLASISLAETFAEVEPFKTAIVLKFQRSWPFVAYALILLAIGLFVERFYCRYLCPLGAALAIPARIRTFDWLKRYRECGTRCHICSEECFVKAIHPTGEINPNECLYCLHCQVRYQDAEVCPVCIKRARNKPDKAVHAPSGPRVEFPHLTREGDRHERQLQT